jgi:hypothetical protein
LRAAKPTPFIPLISNIPRISTHACLRLQTANQLRICDKFDELTAQEGAEEAEPERFFSLCCLCCLMFVVLIAAAEPRLRESVLLTIDFFVRCANL